jgi:superfamily I DNA and/or RNA helicase
LQGPPGTGKTTVLAEIVLQILKRKPDARLLVTSQSNVAVNHLIDRLADLCRNQPIEMVRIGREDKISQGAEAWTLEQRVETWRSEILAQTDQVLDTFKDQIKGYRQQRKQHVTLSPEEIAEMEQWRMELEDLEPDIREQEADEQQLPVLARYLAVFQSLPEEQQDIQDEYQQCQTRIAQRAEAISSTLAHIRSQLPEAAQQVVKESLSEEQKRLRRIILNLLGIHEEEDLLVRKQMFVKNWQKVVGKSDDFTEPILDRANLVAATCLTVGKALLRDREFDWVIIDEAGRATAPELLVPLVRARRAILVGDEQQLPPMIDERLREQDLASIGVTKESLTQSLFGTLVEQGQNTQLPVVQMLTMQHRMHPALGRLISDVFYQGLLTHAVTAQERVHGLDWLPRCVTWFSTTRLPEHEETRRGSSYYNRVEVEQCAVLLQRIEASYRQTGVTRQVAVITPYNAQIEELKAKIQPTSSHWQAITIEIAAIDAFQGRDCDIVLYSTVRSNKQANLGFLRDRRRLNVALSRARQALRLVGDLWTLENGRESAGEENPYRRLIKHLRENSEDCAIEALEED